MLLPASSLRGSEGTTEWRNTETKSEKAQNSLPKNPCPRGLFSKPQGLRWHRKYRGSFLRSGLTRGGGGNEQGTVKLQGASETGGSVRCDGLERCKYLAHSSSLPKTKAAESHLDLIMKSHYILWFRGTDPTKLQFSHSVVSNSLWPHGLQHTRPPCPSPTPEVYPNSCPLSWWCHPAISSSVLPFSSCLQSFPGSGSFQISQFFTSGGQSIGVSASISVLPMNTQDWSPLGWTGRLSL